jgi:hypothetical protein
MLSAMNRENFRLLLAVMAFFTLLMVLLADRPNTSVGFGSPFAGPAPAER